MHGDTPTDLLVAAAAHALAAGDPLRALQTLSMRDDAHAMALRGIAMAQLGDLPRARQAMRKAMRGFASHDTLSRARCAVAQAEISLASRDLNWPGGPLDDACITLRAHHDDANAAYATCLQARRLLLIGQADAASQAIAGLDTHALPPAIRAAHALTVAGIAIRRTQATAAHAALERARSAAALAGIASLVAEIDDTGHALEQPVARLVAGTETLLSLGDVEKLFASDTLVIDACRYAVHHAGRTVSLASRPALFSLARALGQAWPDDVPRTTLITLAFGTRYMDETHRVRLRVEIARLRAALAPVADVHATTKGFVLSARNAAKVAVLAHLADEKHAAILALLADGQLWSSSALAIALSTSQRTIQRSLEALAAQHKAQPYGQGRARRWLAAPVPGFTTALLLPPPIHGS
jgi:hypothetical protein